jgi:hypothetical protein
MEWKTTRIQAGGGALNDAGTQASLARNGASPAP